MPKTCLHLYEGPGKGKTTAAMGLALRALGHGQRVLAAQFMKDGTSGELAALRALPLCTVRVEPMAGFLREMTPQEQAEAARRQEAFALRLSREVAAERPQLVILDELAVALSTALVSRSAAETLLDACLACAETVVTGFEAPAWLSGRADYRTHMACLRHPYATSRQPAREGVEF